MAVLMCSADQQTVTTLLRGVAEAQGLAVSAQADGLALVCNRKASLAVRIVARQEQTELTIERVSRWRLEWALALMLSLMFIVAISGILLPTTLSSTTMLLLASLWGSSAVIMYKIARTFLTWSKCVCRIVAELQTRVPCVLVAPTPTPKSKILNEEALPSITTFFMIIVWITLPFYRLVAVPLLAASLGAQYAAMHRTQVSRWANISSGMTSAFLCSYLLIAIYVFAIASFGLYLTTHIWPRSYKLVELTDTSFNAIATAVESHRTMALIVVILPLAYFLPLFLIGVKKRCDKYWQLYLLRATTQDFSIPYPDPELHTSDRKVILVTYLTSSLSYWASIILSINFVVAMVSPESSMAVSRIACQVCYATMLTWFGASWSIPTTALFAIPIAIPLLTVMSLPLIRARRLLSRKAEELGDAHEWIGELVNRTCAEQSWSTPKLKIIERSENQVFSEFGCIYLDRWVLDNLTTEEIKAIVLHELYHCRHGVRKMVLLKTLSFVVTPPFYFLSLLYDFDKDERGADLFAVQRTGSSSGLIASIVKLSVRQAFFGKEIPHSWWEFIIPWAFRDSLVNAAYRPLGERIEFIRRATLFLSS